MGQADSMNSRGFHPAVLQHPDRCAACAQCALMCPDACMRILKYE
jgi:2-oxoglutarate ferredoxin oxidoreductase subunit delta